MLRLRSNIILELLHTLAPEYDYPQVAGAPGEWEPVACPVHRSGKLNAGIRVNTEKNPTDPGVLWCFPCGRRFTPVGLVMELKGLDKKGAWAWLEQHDFCEKVTAWGRPEGGFTSML